MYNFTLEKALKHFISISKHKILVAKYCFKCGKYYRGITHDNSKFGIVEFFDCTKYYTGTISPINTSKKVNGYSISWQHHKKVNPHHFEYWIDNIGTKENTPIKIPIDYLIEMICDWVAAGKYYSSKTWDNTYPLQFYMREKNNMILHEDTEVKLVECLTIISYNGLNCFCNMCKKGLINY